MAAERDWRTELEGWLEPFLVGLSHPSRRRMCPFYIAGLIGPGDRKSVQPMAARADEVGYDQLHHFIAAGVWDSAPLDAALLPMKPAGAAAPSHLADAAARGFSKVGGNRDPQPLPLHPLAGAG